MNIKYLKKFSLIDENKKIKNENCLTIIFSLK